MIPFIPVAYQLLAKIILAGLIVGLIVFTWNRYIAEPYREQGRSELRAESLSKSIEINAWQESSNLLLVSIETQNKLVQEYKASTKAAQNRTAEAIKKSKVIQEAREAFLNKAQNSGIAIQSCIDEVELAKSQLKNKK